MSARITIDLNNVSADPTPAGYVPLPVVDPANPTPNEVQLEAENLNRAKVAAKQASYGISNRPSTIDGCMSSWSETQATNTVRSAMEYMTVKVRRRTTGILRNAECSLSFAIGRPDQAGKTKLDHIIDWFNEDCDGGALPTLIKEPDFYLTKTETVWRFKEAPKISWTTREVVQVNFSLEQMPSWRDIGKKVT